MQWLTHIYKFSIIPHSVFSLCKPSECQTTVPKSFLLLLLYVVLFGIWKSCFKRQIPKSIPISVTLKSKLHWSYNFQHRPSTAITYKEKKKNQQNCFKWFLAKKLLMKNPDSKMAINIIWNWIIWGSFYNCILI